MEVNLRFEQGVGSHVGCIRAANQDTLLARPKDGLWVVADGMGGHLHGGWAASIVTDTLDRVPITGTIDRAAADMSAALADANHIIWARSEQIGDPIGSTVAALLIRQSECRICWAGDSRVYRHRNGRLLQLTADHSQVEQLVQSGLVNPADVADHPMGHILLRAVGVDRELVLDQRSYEVLPGDIFLLCSDGLTRTASAMEIGKLIEVQSPSRSASALINLALERGAPDNVTVLVVACDATTLVERA